MTKQVLYLFTLISLINFGYTSLVPYLTKCTAADDKCILSSAQAILPMFAQGIPELGMKSLDPLVFTKPIDASTNGLKLIISDLTVRGLKDCSLTKAVRDVSKSKLFGKIVCDPVADGNYEMEGNLLILRVHGNGKINVNLRKISISLDIDIEDKIGKDGKKYWDIKRFSHKYELLDKSDVNFENLFSGNDVLGQAASQVIENSSNEIVLEVGPPVILEITKKVVENIKKFFSKVPVEDLALD